MKKISLFHRKTFALCLVCYICHISLGIGQGSTLTNEAIWTQGAFSTASVSNLFFLNDGTHYTALEGGNIVRYDLRTGDQDAVLFEEKTLKNHGVSERVSRYAFSADEERILLYTDVEKIYRRSFKTRVFVFDRNSKNILSISDGKVMHPAFSPDGRYVSFVQDNNLFIRNLRTGAIRQITQDGETNSIINGSGDWVYEEEFQLTQAYAWSPDSRMISYMRFDESMVREYELIFYRDAVYPEKVTYKYPKVGEQNAEVSVHIYTLEKNTVTDVERTSAPDGYIPRMQWAEDASALCVFHLNRHQNHLQLLMADPVSGRVSLLLEEKNPYYIRIHDDLTFLDDQAGFVWTSEREGWNQIYFYNMEGEVLRKLTPDPYDVTDVYGLDEERRMVYYQAASPVPMQRQVFAVPLDSGSPRLILGDPGTNSATFSSTYDYLIWQFSTINTPPVYTLVDLEGRKVRDLEQNADLFDRQQIYRAQPMELFQFENTEEITLNGWMLKPPDFDPQKQYPLLLYVYGGPGNQQVLDSWRGTRYWWFQMLAQDGYVVACVDNRGTGGRGEEFRKMTYLQLGHYETIDQIDAARYLGNLPFVDAARIGIFGWSYGGFLSSLSILKGNAVFKAAIAVAPVTNWKWYDSIYTERYMRTEEENHDGYQENAPVHLASQLKGHYLLVHGLADDNVHFQHSAEMARALIKENKPFETYYYPNRNHSIRGENALLHLYERMTDFIRRNI